MDPLSITASIIAIVQLTGSCLKLAKIGPSVHKSSRLKEIQSTLYALNGTIRNLQTHLEISEEDTARLTVLDHLQRPLTQCTEALSLLNSRIRQNSFLTQYVTGLRFDKKLEDCLHVLAEARSLLELALQCDQSVLVKAVETYVRNVAEETQAIHQGVEVLLKRLDLESTVAAENAEKNHQQQCESIATLLQAVENVGGQVRSQAQDLAAQRQAEHRSSALSWLSSLEYRSNYLDVLHTREPGTGQWLMQTDVYATWQQGSDNGLWLHAMPGAGKTYLAAAVINYLERNTRNNIAFFFFDFKNQDKQSAENMLRSIATQIHGELYTDRLSPALETLYAMCKQTSGYRQPTLNEVLHLIEMAITTEPIVVVLDALDECNEREKSCRILNQLRRSAPHLKFLVTSRREADIVEALDEGAFVGFPLEGDSLKADIQLYIRSALTDDVHLRKLPNELKSHIEAALSTGANSMFRWVKCQLDAIKPLKRAKAIKEALKTLPKTLDETYERILLQLIEKNGEEECFLIRRIFMFVALSERPMSLSELAQAVTTEIGSRAVDHDAAFHNPEDLLSLCQPLVSPSDTTGLLGFVHYSVQEYLFSPRLAATTGPTKMLRINAKLGHQEISQTCLTLLNFDCFNDGPCKSEEQFWSRLDDFPFLTYAADYWSNHLKHGDVAESMSELLHTLLIPYNNQKASVMLQASSSLKFDCDWGTDFIELRSSPLDFDKHPTSWLTNTLAIAVQLGLESTVAAIVESGADIDAPGTRHGNPLQTAVFADNISMAKLLIRLGANINCPNTKKHVGTCDTALITAIMFEHRELIDYLLDIGADVNCGTEPYYTPLNTAAFINDSKTLKRLISLGADVNYGIDDQSRESLLLDQNSALCFASHYSSVDAAIILVAAGASLGQGSMLDLAHDTFRCGSNSEYFRSEINKLVSGLALLGHYIELVEVTRNPEGMAGMFRIAKYTVHSELETRVIEENRLRLLR